MTLADVPRAGSRRAGRLTGWIPHLGLPSCRDGDPRWLPCVVGDPCGRGLILGGATSDVAAQPGGPLGRGARQLRREVHRGPGRRSRSTWTATSWGRRSPSTSTGRPSSTSGAGSATRSGRRRGRKDTIVNVWSTTKCVLSLAALMLVERGGARRLRAGRRLLARVLGQGARRTSQVRHLMSHMLGRPRLGAALQDQGHVRLGDRDRAARRRSGPGGSRERRRATTRPTRATWSARSSGGSPGGTFKQFVAEQIAGPLGADFQVGRSRGRTGNVIAPLVPRHRGPRRTPTST